MNRVVVSMAPPQAWVNRMPASWGNVSTNWRASFSNVVGRASWAGVTRLPGW